MSITDEIKDRCAQRRLFALSPKLPSARAVRGMFVSREIHAAISRDDMRFGKLRGDLDAFTEGRLLSIALDPFDKEKAAYIARVDPVRDEVWQIRSRDPSPAIRVFGHFAMTDVFIGLTWRFRKELIDDKDWDQEVKRCKAEWRKLFNPYKPHRGKDVSEYISDRFRLA